MNKAELFEIAGNAGIIRVEAGKVMDAVAVTGMATLKRGGRVTIKGFELFTVISQSARNRRNPQTGAIIKVSATRRPIYRG